MRLAEIMLPEFDREMARTRRTLEAVRAEHFDRKCHDSLHSIGWNVNHIVEIVGWAPMIIQYPEFDMAPVNGPKYETGNISDPAKILAEFDNNVVQARAALAAASDATLAEPWSLKSGGQIYFTIPKGECLRTWVFNHLVHHRAILPVCLRMCGAEVAPPYDS